MACNGSGSSNENDYGSGSGNTDGISNGNSSSTICSRRDNLPAITKLPVHVCGPDTGPGMQLLSCRSSDVFFVVVVVVLLLPK